MSIKICDTFTDNKYTTQYFSDTSGAQLKRAKLNAAHGKSDKKTDKQDQLKQENLQKKRSKRHDRIKKQTERQRPV